MGSLVSGPKPPPAPPPQPTVIYTPPPAPPSEPPTPGETPAEARRKSLLGRDRGRFGTVLTGFRGLLGLSNNAPQRKSLLGE